MLSRSLVTWSAMLRCRRVKAMNNNSLFFLVQYNVGANDPLFQCKLNHLHHLDQHHNNMSHVARANTLAAFLFCNCHEKWQPVIPKSFVQSDKSGEIDSDAQRHSCCWSLLLIQFRWVDSSCRLVLVASCYFSYRFDTVSIHHVPVRCWKWSMTKFLASVGDGNDGDGYGLEECL